VLRFNNVNGRCLKESMKHCWKNTDAAKLKYSEKNYVLVPLYSPQIQHGISLLSYMQMVFASNSGHGIHHPDAFVVSSVHTPVCHDSTLHCI
jgi:hypothetical protein